MVSKRMVKKQQMGWTKKGAHLLLQERSQVLNDDLQATFERWYPAMEKRGFCSSRLPSLRFEMLS